MTKTITRVYGDYAAAENAVRELEAAGLSDSNIGFVASNADGWHKPGSSNVDPRHDKARHGNDDRVTGAATGGGLGAVVLDPRRRRKIIAPSVARGARTMNGIR